MVFGVPGGPWVAQVRFSIDAGADIGIGLGFENQQTLKLDSRINLYRHFHRSDGLQGHYWHLFWGYVRTHVWDPSCEGAFLEIIEHPMGKQLFSRFRGFQQRIKQHQKATSNRDRAATASWEAPGIVF